MELYGYSQRQSIKQLQYNAAEKNYNRLKTTLPNFVVHYDFGHIITIYVERNSYVSKLWNIGIVKESLGILYIITYFNERIWPQMRDHHPNKHDCFQYFICVTLKNKSNWNWIKWNYIYQTKIQNTTLLV